jgi:ribosomal-protein-alanine N-acetyltransferase
MKNRILPIIKTERLILRQFEKSDSYYMFVNWANDEENTKYTNGKAAENENDCESIINLWENYYDKGLFMWAVCLKESNEPIGMIGFELAEKPEISFTVGKKYNNRGYATEALVAVLQFGVNNLGVKCFWGYHFTENASSGRVMQKAGMAYVRSDIKLNKFFNKDMTIEIYEYDAKIIKRQM